MTLQAVTATVLAPIRHGFFTRRGGASSGIFVGLNCGLGSSDQREAVAMNRARVAEALNSTPEAMVFVHQVHSAEAVAVDAPFAGPPPRADAIVTATPGLVLTVLTADCQPILLADAGAGVIGAVHAGWRGTLDGVIEATVAAMIGLGARPDRTAAVIGPTISQQNYEVGQEFLETFEAEDPDSLRYFANGAPGKYQFDLPGYGLHRLRAAGLAHAEWCGHCTYADPERFYSYRRSVHLGEADYGRLLSAIRL